jgi:TRAP-type uncharacterized transport system substrate-binding protein
VAASSAVPVRMKAAAGGAGGSWHAIHPAAETFDPARAARDPGGPLHDGAARYVRKRGWFP